MPRPHPPTALLALYKIFIQPALSSKPPLRLCLRLQPLQIHPSKCRPFSHTTRPLAAHTKPRPSQLRSEKHNDEIRSAQIYLIDPATNRLSDPNTNAPPRPHNTSDVLARLDRRTHRLVQVSEQQLEDGFGARALPVCKIIDKAEVHRAEKAKKEATRTQRKAQQAARSLKTLELNWAIDPNDLSHRLNKVRDFLNEGRKVEVVMAKKKRGRQATGEECEALVDRIRETVGEVEGAREVKELEGKMGGVATLTLQGRPVVGGAEGAGEDVSAALG